jgi:hypothetical protein
VRRVRFGNSERRISTDVPLLMSLMLFDAGDPRIGGLGRCRQRCDAVQQAVVSTVH